MSSRGFAGIRSVGYAFVFVGVWVWVVRAARPFDERLAVGLPAWLAPPGLLLAGLGLLVVCSCVAAFVLEGRGTPAPFDAPREFVGAGPYRYVRNPMYLGAIAVLIGAGLALRSASTLAVAAGFWVLAHAFVVRYEEPTLERRFGDSYPRYRRRVNRWIPGSPSHTE